LNFLGYGRRLLKEWAMVEENSTCLKCGEGLMKLILDTAELTPQAIKTTLRARCTKCGHEDTASVKPED
jgi:DNA-directed RNA polymerase subunit RPC12/RpoP